MGDDISFKEKLQSLQFNASPRREQVHIDRETDTKSIEIVGDHGEFGGAHVHHKSGRVDAHAVVPPANVFAESKEG